MLTPLKELGRTGEFNVTFRSGSETNTMENPDPPLAAEDFEDKDVMIVQRVNSWLGLDWWRRQSKPGKLTVYELDDDIWNLTPDNRSAFECYRDDPSLCEAVDRYMRDSKLVTASSEHLASLVVERVPAANVTVLPNYVPDWVLDLPRDNQDRRMRIGWFGGSSHARDIEVCAAKPVRTFLQRNPQWDLYLGGMDFSRNFKTPLDRTYFTGWLNICDEERLYFRSLDYDIGICPLVDTKFNRSKTPIKALEMMSRGIPVVASNVEPYEKFIDHGVNGFLVKQEHEWSKYLGLLANDDSFREEMSRNARAKAAENVISKNAWRWAEAYKNALEA